MTSTDNDIQTIVETADRAIPPQPVEAGNLYVVPTATGGREVIDLTGDEYLNVPRRKRGTVRVRDIESLGQYWDKHHTPEVSEVYADIDRDQITAVLDAHAAGAAGWAQHRVTLGVQRTRNWKTWTEFDGKYLEQVEFAEHIRANLPDVVDPDGADLLELAQSFQATTEVNFKSSNQLRSGEFELLYSEQVNASAGRDKKITIPAGLKLLLKPYEDNEPGPITAQFRYRLKEGRVYLGYVLNQPEEVLQNAFNALVTKIEDRLDTNVMRGTPA